MTLTIVNAEIDGRAGRSLHLRDGRIIGVDDDAMLAASDDVVDAQGGAVIPGLHDHHVHLRASAAARSSVDVSPALVADRAELAQRLRAAVARTDADAWVRAVGYHESVAGPLDAATLDAIVGDRLVRVQHRSGALWVLSSAAVRATGAAEADGRLWRRDAWLREHTPAIELDLATVGREAAALGITGFTDADPERTSVDLEALGGVPQRVCAMGPLGLRAGDGVPVTVGPVKVLLDDDALPALSDLVELVTAAHEEGRGVAFHCVTRAQLVLSVATIDDAGPNGCDRIEHGSVIPDTMLSDLQRLAVAVVTQPSFVAERGDAYRRDVDAEDLPHLYRAASLQQHGIGLAAGSDAPYASLDPWAAMRSASTRTLGPDERLSPAAALALFTGEPAHPAVPRTVAVGAPADLVVLSEPLAVALTTPEAELVRATIIRGHLAFLRS